MGVATCQLMADAAARAEEVLLSDTQQEAEKAGALKRK
jgi:hypothetical protein